MIRMPRGTLRALAAGLALSFGCALPMAPALAQAGPGAAGLPTLGGGGALTLGAERRLGERIARELFRDPDYLDDAVLADYVQALWQPLLVAARRRGDLPAEMDERFAWRILLGRDRSINAFAVPGGWLGLHLGLIAATASRDEVAAVLAHELSHVTQRHISRMIDQGDRQAPWVIGAMILGAAVASRNPQAGQAMITGGQAVAARSQLNFSRDMEREADRVGLGVMAEAGFEPAGAVTMFEKLAQASRLSDDGAFAYLRTHPLTSERISDMRARLPVQAMPVARVDPLHGVMAARARALSASGADALRGLVREADALAADAPQPRQLAALYGGTLAALKLREPSAAVRLQARLARLEAPDPAVARALRLLEGEVALATGDAGRALRVAGMRPTLRPELLLSAEAGLRAAQPESVAQAAERLQAWVADHPTDASAWQLLSQAQAARGQPLRALRAEAEARIAMLDYDAAVDRLRAAQEQARRGGGDHIEASIIDTRLRQVQSLLREQAAER